MSGEGTVRGQLVRGSPALTCVPQHTTCVPQQPLTSILLRKGSGCAVVPVVGETLKGAMSGRGIIYGQVVRGPLPALTCVLQLATRCIT